MKALTYIEHGKFALMDKPKPVILDPGRYRGGLPGVRGETGWGD